MRNHLMTNGPLLDEEGNLCEAGYALSLVKQYDRNRILASKLRVKEWDYYLIYNDSYAVALTLADNSYMGLCGVSVLDFKKKSEHTENVMTLLPLLRTGMPETSEKGVVRFHNQRIKIEFCNEGGRRKLFFEMKNFYKEETFQASFVLKEQPPKESIVIATPFKKPKHFYYNQKVIGMMAQGTVAVGRKRMDFKEGSFGLLDWGRGVWEYDNTWYWSAAQGLIGGKVFGFNLGYGFGDTTGATENMLFYEGKAHKLDDVSFEIPIGYRKTIDYMSPWRFTSSDQRFEAVFTPILDRANKTNAMLIMSDQHQVFGKFNGYAVLDDKTVIHMKDFLGFAERVRNKW